MTPSAIVTASDSGIGKASAVQLARAGFDIAITWHTDEAGANGTAEEVRSAGRRAEVRQVDLTQLPGAAGVIDELDEALGGVDVLVNNAGGGDTGPFLELSWEGWRSVLALNLDSAFLCAQVAARRMVQAGKGGRIINITSVHEHVPLQEAAAYCAAKGGLGLLTKVIALELAPHGITVNAVAPGEIATPLTGNPDVDPETVERPGIPLKRVGGAHEIAAVVTFLAGAQASYVTGESVLADGGLTLMSAVQNAS